MKLTALSKTILPFVSLILITTICGSTRGQAAVKVTGSVSDPLSVGIADARISLYSLDRILQTTSDSSGHFQFDAVRPGNYELEVAAQGFKRFIQPNLSVSNLRNATQSKLTVSMEVGATSGPIVVIPATVVAPINACGPSYSAVYGSRNTADAGGLNGILIDQYPKMPVAGATLKLVDAKGALTAQLKTDERGKFMFKQTAPGRYHIRLEHPGYNDTTTPDFWIARENTTHVTIQAVQLGKIVICQ